MSNGSGDAFSKSAIAKRRSNFEKAEFAQNYKPQSTFLGRLGGGMKSMLLGLPKIPGALTQTFKETMHDQDVGYDINKPFWTQAFKPISSFDEYKRRVGIGARNILGFPNMVLNAPYMENIEGLNRFKENNPFFQKSAVSDLLNKLLLDSIIKGTGSYIYNPDVKGRRWFSNPRQEGSRWREFLENPAEVGIEDLVNILIVFGPAAKAGGLGAKMSGLARYGKISKYAPKHGIPTSTLGARGIPQMGKYGQLTAFGRATEPIVKGVNRNLEKLIKFAKERQALQTMITKYYEATSQHRGGILGQFGRKMKEINALPEHLKAEALGSMQTLGPFNAGNVTYGPSSVWKGSKVAGIDALKSASQYLRSAGSKQTKSLLAKGYFGRTKILKSGKFSVAEPYVEPIKDVLRSKFQGLVNEFPDITVKQMMDFGIRPEHFYFTAKESGKIASRAAKYAKGGAKVTGGIRKLGKKKVGPLQKRMSIEDAWVDKNLLRIPQGDWKVVSGKIQERLLQEVKMRFAKQIKSGEILPGYTEVDKFLFKTLTEGKNPLLGATTKENLRLVRKAKQLVSQKNISLKTALRQVGYGKKVRYQIPDFVAKELNNVLNAPGSFEKFMRMSFDKGTRIWKMSVLALSPRWLFNNLVGNTVLNMLGKVNPLAYYKASRIMLQAKKLSKKNKWPLMRAYKKLGIDPKVLESGFYKGEAGVTFGKTIERGKGISVGEALEATGKMTKFKKYTGYTAVKWIADKMYGVNSGIETFYRTAHYLDKMGFTAQGAKRIAGAGRVVGGGFSKTQAVRSVNEFLFKYSNMSFAEKAIIRRLDPFWAWHKNIIRLAMSYPIKHPMRTALLAIVERMEKDENDYRFVQEWVGSMVELPEFMQDWIPGDDPAYLSTSGMNPFSDLFVDLGVLHPLAKMFIERQTGTQLFKGRGFTSPYPNIQGGVEEKALPSLARHFAMQFPQARTIESMFRPYATYDTGQPMIDKETGGYKYPKNRWLELLKQTGVSISPYDMEGMEQTGKDRAFRAWKQRNSYDELRRNLR